ncbi:MAG: Lrp/AsnC family transcriptional regulator, partial [Solirubrobacterales bacterium]|nr:Lrp/AsnC family transcriptional regulator [Solirubrobacterales bacterium]MBV9838162.1 Lrp/AsnC family transcriptional regulator [Solirubrobacterales bacterium]
MKNGIYTSRGQGFVDLDEIDRSIVRELTSDGRLPFAELGRRINLSPPATAERVRRLEQTGVITGYRAEVDPRALGYQLAAIVRVTPAAGQLRRIA